MNCATDYARACPSASRTMKQASSSKSKTGIGRPLHPYHAVSNIQDPIARRPSGMRVKVRHGFCHHRYALFNLDLHSPGQPPRYLRTSSRVFRVYLIVAMSAAIRRASSRVSSLAAARLPGSSSK